MLDGDHYEILRKKYAKYGILYESQEDTREAFEALLESVGMILRHHEDTIKEMADWYQAQEAKIHQERTRIQRMGKIGMSHQERELRELLALALRALNQIPNNGISIKGFTSTYKLLHHIENRLNALEGEDA